MQWNITRIFYLICVLCVAIIFLIDSTWLIGIQGSLDVKTNSARASDKKTIHELESEVNDFSVASKWEIVLTVNFGFIDLFRNWLWYFKRLNIKVNVTVIAEDDFVYQRLCKETNTQFLKIVRSWILNISEPLRYGSASYNKLGSVRPVYILQYLQAGHGVLYTDVDTVWLQNPFPYFTGTYDIWAQPEKYGVEICAGFMAVRYNARTIHVVGLWKTELRRKSQVNQPALNILIKQHNISVHYLNEALFIGGHEASNMTVKQLHSVAVVHATYCVEVGNKRNCLKKWNLWHDN